MKLFTLLALLLSSLSIFAQSPKYIGELKSYRGKVFKQINGYLSPVSMGEKFSQNEAIVTQDKSFAKIQMIDETILTLSENSELKFSNFKFKNKNEREGVFDFVKGQIRALVKNKSPKKDALQFKTKFAAMAVRGTELLINHRSLNAKEISEFALVEGVAGVFEGNKQLSEIKKGQRIVVATDPSTGISQHENRPLSAKEISELNIDESFLPFSQEPQMAMNTDIMENSAPMESTEVEDEERRGNVEKNLKRLNEKLKEYQKRP